MNPEMPQTISHADFVGKEIISVEDCAVELLNEFFKLDPEGCKKLVEYRVTTNGDVANHPTIVVDDSGEKPKVGLVGIINGILSKFNVDGKRVAIMMDGTKLVGFTVYRPPA